MAEPPQKRSALFWVTVATIAAVLVLGVAITIAMLLSSGGPAPSID